MHAYVICGGTIEDRKNKINTYTRDWGVNGFDCLVIEPLESSIGITLIKSAIQTLLRSPQYSKTTLLIVYNAHMLTTEAQNALLKTLEEPPKHVRIIMETDKPDTLLPTILSRCQIFSFGSQTQQGSLLTQEIVTACVSGSMSQKLITTESVLKDTPESSVFLTQFCLTFHRILLAHYGVMKSEVAVPSIHIPSVIQLLKKSFKGFQMNTANIQSKTVIDYLLFQL